MWVYDTTTLAFLAVNDAAIAKYGHSRSEFLSMTIKDIRPEEDVPRLIENVKSQKMGLDEAGNWRHRKKDGTIIDVEITSHSLTYEGKNAKLVSAHDITKRKQAEESLRASEERYRRLFEENLTGNFISTPDGVLLSCNLAFARIFGFASVEEAMQCNVKALYPDDSQREALVTQLLTNKRIENYEQVLRRRDGTLIHVVENVIGTFHEHGELIEIKGYLFDDTKRKHLEEQMIQLQKMESIGRLAGGIAHDFNNILGIILGHSTMLDALVDNPAKLSRSIENINKAVQRGSGLVRQILTFARKTNVLFEPVMLNELVSEMEKMLDGTFPKTIEISLQLEKGLPFIDADRTQLHQALLNLCVNARDAMPNGGKLFIRTSKTKGDNLREQGRDATATEYVQIQVSDTGSGMDEATKKRIFEPFFTTKEIGKGTGLGLSVVYGIMKSHRGIVDVETAQGRGTTFLLYFPVHEEVSKAVKADKELSAEVDGGTETILFVEDEQMLRDLVSSLLQAKGYKILTASNGVEAMDVYVQRKDEIELILTDIGLPKMSGLEMVKKIREMNAAAKVILASGYLDPDDKSELLKAGAHEFVEKPYLPDELFRKIRQVIGGPQVDKKQETLSR
jgi:PAS domain S-box-containing protein